MAADEIHAVQARNLRALHAEFGPRCGAVLDAYSQPVSCQREAGHPGNRHEAPGVSWVSA